MVFSKEFPKKTYQIGEIGVDNVVYKVARLKEGYLYSSFYEELTDGIQPLVLKPDNASINNIISNNRVVFNVNEIYSIKSGDLLTFYNKNTLKTRTGLVNKITEFEDGFTLEITEIYTLNGTKLNDYIIKTPILNKGENYSFLNPIKMFNKEYLDLEKFMIDNYNQLITNHGISDDYNQPNVQFPKIKNYLKPTKVACWPFNEAPQEVYPILYNDDIFNMISDGIYKLGMYSYTNGFVFAYQDLEVARKSVRYLTKKKKQLNESKKKQNLFYQPQEEYQYVILKGEIPPTYPIYNNGELVGNVETYFVKTIDKSTNIGATAMAFYEIVEQTEPFV